MRRIVLDTSAVMTFFENRSGSEKVEELIKKTMDGKAELMMSMINWGEVYYSVWRARGKDVAEAKLQFLAQIPVEVVAPDAELTKLAASYRAERKLPYADCFAAALAKMRQAEVLTADADFAAIEDEVEVSRL